MAGEIGDYCGIDFIGGGLGAVDKIDGAVLQDKDHFLVVTPTQFAPFSLDDDSGAGESSPEIITPNTNPGDKRWILAGGVFAGLQLRRANSHLRIHCLGADADEKDWLIDSSGGIFRIMAVNDANVVFNHALNINRTGAVIDNIVFSAKVGIGMVPTQRLELAATSCILKMTSTTGTLKIGNWLVNTGGFCAFAREGSAGTEWFTGTAPYSTVVGSTGNYPIQLVTNNVVRLTVLGDGKVGFGGDIAPAEIIDVTGNVNVTGIYKVDDVQIVSNQGAVVADATDPATTMARLNDLLARCRAHGLIAT